MKKRLAGLGIQIEELRRLNYHSDFSHAGAGELEKRLAGLGSQIEELRRLYFYSYMRMRRSW